MKLAVQVQPADDAELLAAARDLVRTLAGAEPVEAPVQGVDAPQRGIEWIALTGLLLAAPQTAAALVDLVGRLARGRGRAEARQRLEPPLTRVQAAAQSGGRQLTLTIGEVTRDLGRSSVDQVLDALAAAGIAAQGARQ